MKRILIVSILLLSVVSCVQEDLGEVDVQVLEDFVLEASAPSDVMSENLLSKTFMSDTGTGYAVHWSDDDAICVNGVTSSSIQVELQNLKSASFQLKGISFPCHAVYPAGVVSDFTSSQATVVIPSRQVYVKDSFDPSAAVMLGYSDSGTALGFSHVMSYLYLTVNTVDGYDPDKIRTVTVKSLGSEPMSGAFTAAFGKDACTLSPSSGTVSTEVSLDCGVCGVDKGTPLVIALPSGLYASGLSIAVEDVEGDVTTLKAATKIDMKAGYVYTTSLRIAAPGIYNVAGYNAFAKDVNAGDYSKWIGEDGEVNLYADLNSSVNYTYINSFDGVFDGNGHTVSCTNKSRPLFNSIAAKAVVKNLTAAGKYVALEAQGEQGFSSFARVNLGTIQDCCNQTDGDLTATAAVAFGGFVGQNGGVIRDCVNEGDIKLTLKTTGNIVCYGGGFAAWGHTVSGGNATSTSISGKFIGCTNKGQIIVTVRDGASLAKTGFGGICGVVMKDGVEFDHCTNAVSGKVHRIDVSGSAANNTCASSVGGILGRSASWFNGSTNYVDLDGTLGGFNTKFTACTNAGEVANSVRNGNNLGGSDNANTKCGTGGIAGVVVGKGASVPVFDNCMHTGTVMAGYNAENSPHVIGGIVGLARKAQINSCSVVGGKLTSYNGKCVGAAGGLVGYVANEVSISGGVVKPVIDVVQGTGRVLSYGFISGASRTGGQPVATGTAVGGSIKASGSTQSISSSNYTSYLQKNAHNSNAGNFTDCMWLGDTGYDAGVIIPSESGSVLPYSFQELNAGGSQTNSHAGECGRSHLSKMTSMPSVINLSAANDYYTRYPIITDMGSHGYILTWQDGEGQNNNGASTYYAVSSDLKSWTCEGTLFEKKFLRLGSGFSAVYRYYTNATTHLLSDGRLMAVASFWCTDTYSSSGVDAQDNYVLDQAMKDHGIVVKFSSDYGRTWGSEQVVYYGPNWETHVMEPATGHIELYFAESRPKISGSHSGTSMIYSTDGGKNWSPAPGNKPYRVMRKYWTDSSNAGGLSEKFTYQMPVGIRLNGSNQMAFAMECITGSVGSPTHHISVVYSPESGQWKYLEGNEVGPAGNNLENFTKGIRPYLLQFPSGETVLSYSVSNKMKYRIGDAMATNFGSEAVLLDNSIGTWGSMELDSDHMLIAVDRKSSDQNATDKLAMGVFALNHSITASERSVTTDGFQSEWEDSDEALYLGVVENTEALIRCSADGDNIYLLVEVIDAAASDSDDVRLTLAGENFGFDSKRVHLNNKGVTKVEWYNGGWESMPSKISGKVLKDSAVGYIAEIAIPRAELGVKGGKLLFNATFHKSSGAQSSISAFETTEDWVYIKGL